MRGMLAFLLMAALLAGCEDSNSSSPMTPLPGALKDLPPPPPPAPPPPPKALPLEPTPDVKPDPQAGLHLSQEMFDKAEALRAKDPAGAMALYSEVVSTTAAKSELRVKAEKRMDELKADKRKKSSGGDKEKAPTPAKKGAKPPAKTGSKHK
jgi:hypothetical protein